MTDLEDLLRDELGVVADGRSRVRVDAVGLRRLVRGERRRRTTAALAGTAAAVVILVVLASMLPRGGAADVAPAGSEDPPTSMRDLAVGPPLALVWATPSGLLHLPDGRTLQVDGLSSVFHRGSTTVVGAGEPGAVRYSYVAEEDAGPRLLPLTASSVGTPVLSVGGDRVAWADSASTELPSGSWRVSSFDVTARTASVVDVPIGSGPESLLGVFAVDDDGRVLLGQRGASGLLWTPQTAPVPIQGLSGSDAAGILLPGGRVVTYPLHGGPTQLADLASDGTAAVVGPLLPGPVYGFNDDGTAGAATGGQLRSLVTVAPDGSTSTAGPLALPTQEGQQWSPVGWESSTDVVLRDSSRDETVGRGDPWPLGDVADLARCSVVSNTCERVPADGERIVAGP